jgi:adenosylmethionine-8-amino-7-oxononanoate aminotransferase
MQFSSDPTQARYGAARPVPATAVATAAPPLATDALWRNFGDISAESVRVVARGSGTRVYDTSGREFLDALSSLYCTNVGHGRQEIGEAMARQAGTLAYFPAWELATVVAAELAERIAGLAPPGLNRVFFTSGGAEAIDAAWKLCRQYHRLRGKPEKFGVIARQGAYHGTTLGALAITGIPSLREPFEPLLEGVHHAPWQRDAGSGVSSRADSIASFEALADLVEQVGPEHLGAVIVEPVQNSGGCLTPHPDYYRLLRELCDQHDLLLVSDEIICSWGRLGTMFGSEHFGYVPDLITTAKGLTSAYAPMGAVIISERVADPFLRPDARFSHGLTFGGHPVAAAAAMANIDILEREQLCSRAVHMGERLRDGLEALREIPVVGDVRGIALFQAIELVGPEHRALTTEQTTTLAAALPELIYEQGMICRVLHRGAPVLQFAPPLVASEEDIDRVIAIGRMALERAAELLL